MVANSILEETKASLGVTPELLVYDTEIRMHINTALADAAQLGVGPVAGYTVESKNDTWDEITNDNPLLNSLKSYIHLRVKMLFDPPDTGFVLTAMKEQIEKAEWRMCLAAEEIGGLAPASSQTLEMIYGQPFIQTVRVKNAASIWSTIDELEVRAQLRNGPSVNDRLLINLHEHMTAVFEGTDLLITFNLTGAKTAELLNRPWERNSREYLGYFNIVVSDVGTTDSRAVVVPTIMVRGVPSTVRTAGSV